MSTLITSSLWLILGAALLGLLYVWLTHLISTDRRERQRELEECAEAEDYFNRRRDRAGRPIPKSEDFARFIPAHVLEEHRRLKAETNQHEKEN